MASAPPASPFSGDGHHDRGAQGGHLAEVPGDRLRLPPLLGVEARVGARRVDQGEDRAAELRRELHHPHRLAVALRLGHPEVAVHLLLRVPPLLVPEHAHRPLVEEGEAADEGGVVPVPAVPVELRPVGEEGLHVVERVGPVGVAGHERLLPRGEPPVDLAAQGVELLAEPPRLLLLRPVPRPLEKLVDPLLQGDERRLEVRLGHGPPSVPRAQASRRGPLPRARTSAPGPRSASISSRIPASGRTL